MASKAEGASDWDNNGGDGGFGMITETKPAAFNGVVGKEDRDRREFSGYFGKMSKEVVCSGCDVMSEGRVPSC